MAVSVDVVRAVGDRHLPIRGAFEHRPNGAWIPVDLTGADVEFRMVPVVAPHTPVEINWLSAVIEDEEAGLVYYAPSAADVDTAGEYLAWFRATIDGLTLTAPADGFRISLRHVPGSAAVLTGTASLDLDATATLS